MTSYLSILKLVWPLAIGMVNNAVMQFTDRAFLAHESMASLEAVMPASMLVLIGLGFFQAVVAYSGTFVAQYHGAGDEKSAARCFYVGFCIAVVSGFAMAALVPLGGWVFSLVGHAPEVVAREKAYYDICSYGGFFLFGQMAGQAYFTGIGRTRLVLAVNVIGNLVNVALDPLLIFGLWGVPRMGISGAAFATVLATVVQLVIFVVAAVLHFRSFGMRRSDYDLRQSIPLMGRILRYGIASGGYAVLNLLSFTIFIFITGRVGDVAFAVSNACFSINYLLFAPMEGFALGAATLVAQAQGRGDAAAAMRNGNRTLALALATVTVLSLSVVVFHRPILSIFAPADPAVAEQFHSLGFVLCVLMASWQVFDAADVVMSGALKGAGDTKFVFWWMNFSAFVVWMPLVLAVAKWHNTMMALWATMVVYVVVICAGTAVRWYRGSWKAIRLV